jgi:outer membrane protein TolC
MKRTPIAPMQQKWKKSVLRVAVLLALSTPIRLCAQQTATASSPGESAGVHLTLPVAVEMAMKKNRHLLLAHDNVRDNEEQKRIAQSHFYPIIKNESAALHITELEGIIIPAGAIGNPAATGSLPSQTLRIDQGGAISYTSGTGLTQPITQAFKIRAGVRAADADLRSAKIQSSDAENGIALEVHQLYYNLLIEQTRGTAAQEAVDAAAATEEENVRGVREGRLLADAELGSRANLLDKQQAALVSRLNLDDLTLHLDDVLGLPLDTKLVLDAEGVGALPAVPTRAEALTRALSSSPTVLEARQTVEKAKAGVAAAKDAYIPDITGLARYSYQSGLPLLEHNFGTFGGAFSYELFNGGAREAGLRDARIKLSMAQTQAQQVENDVRIELSTAYDKTEELEQLVTVATQALDAREESFRIQTQRKEVNAELASGVATAKAGVASARMNLLSARLNLFLVKNNIQRLLGDRPE